MFCSVMFVVTCVYALTIREIQHFKEGCENEGQESFDF